MIMETGADGPEWSVEQQRSVRIGRQNETPLPDAVGLRRRRKRQWLSGGIMLAALTATWLLWLHPMPPIVLRNADFDSGRACSAFLFRRVPQARMILSARNKETGSQSGTATKEIRRVHSLSPVNVLSDHQKPSLFQNVSTGQPQEKPFW
jgi:hypothetical protein